MGVFWHPITPCLRPWTCMHTLSTKFVHRDKVIQKRVVCTCTQIHWHCSSLQTLNTRTRSMKHKHTSISKTQKKRRVVLILNCHRPGQGLSWGAKSSPISDGVGELVSNSSIVEGLQRRSHLSKIGDVYPPSLPFSASPRFPFRGPTPWSQLRCLGNPEPGH